MKKIILCFVFLGVGLLNAQDFPSVIDSYFNENKSQLGLNTQDFEDIRIYNQHYSESTKVNHVYVVQRYQGVELFNATSNFAIDNNGNVKYATIDFLQGVSQKINSATPGLTPDQAIYQAASQLGLNAPTGLELIEQTESNKYLFNSGNISQENINVKLVFQPNTNQTRLRLAWDLDILILDGDHWYSVRIDAQTGELLSTHDWISKCNFGEAHFSSHTNQLNSSTKSILEVETASFTPNDGSQYLVFPMPVESPSHGNAVLVSEPGDPVASPFGWHDTDGVVGAEFTTTRGNNVRARADIAGNNTGNYTEGGNDLEFEFEIDFNQQPIGYVDASTTNLFYWNNIIHDVFYRYGFDEQSGNFQETNYTGQGLGGDAVNADAQDGSGMNNANFGTPPEGNRPRMQMFLWSAQGPPGEPLTINNGPLAGDYTGLGAQFGDPIPTTPLTADLALVKDDNSGPSTDIYDACDLITNGGEIDGKIAVIRRGECQFGFKVLAAENEGAIAVIMINNVPGEPIAMGPGDVGDQVTIPSLMINQSDGDAIIDALINGQIINVTLEDAGPYMIDGTLDNGIIAHEYGHGISNRLTGGAFNSNCLSNDEQMGEGWSDYFGLILTMKAEDTPDQPRGIGTFAVGQPTNGNGIRPAPYSTSFAVNPYTYTATNNAGISQPHGIGFVWATMLWDLTWALVDEYGFDPDIYEGTGGNNIALQLVVDGLKLQNCSPGFVNGRDAILQADELANDGVNQCLIWNVFANRGLGLSASQGNSNNRFDQVEAFDVPEECLLGTQGQSFNNFMIYPNPSQGNINIVSRQNMGDSTISIYDINGRKVFSQNVMMSGAVNIQADNLNTGVYILQIEGEDYTHNAKLIIK
ncbi:T9SS-dependent M36 family metallopeptidase [uncultured Planktosalinus sp.]|uniref:T9SS-dependent M36 family metallopeptidase n=1 Tax=uncultured Planktosalinus sp. TaxID=1810935 RepID=UPI0030DC8FB7